MPDAAAPAIAPQERDPDLLGVSDWCAQTSTSDSRVEMLSGFHADEMRHGRQRDTAENYETRFKLFVIRPV